MIFKKGKASKKKKKKKIVIAVILVAAAGAAGTAAYQKIKKPARDGGDKQEANEAQVTLGSISNTIIGTGNLELDEAEAVTVPSGITIEEVFAESGDYVSAGTVLASVEESSVLSAIEDTQEELEALDEQISQCQEAEDENVITSSVSGRVKAIFVEEGSDVTEVMLDQGALMTLSLDGLMAVDLEGNIQTEEDAQTEVALSDGTVATGTVEAAGEWGCTVVISDDTAPVGDTVTVTAEDGTSLGSGTLYIHNPLEITGTAGKIEEVEVSLNEEVVSGEELLILEGTESSAEYEELLAAREAGTATLKKLLQLSEDPQITAPYDGTVQNVNVAASEASSSAEAGASGSTAAEGAMAAQTAYSGSVSSERSSGLLLLSFDDGTSGVTEASGEVQKGQSVQTETEMPEKQKLQFAIAGAGTSGGSLLVIPAPEAGGTPVAQIVSSDGTYTGIVTWNPADESFAYGTSYQALVALTAAEGYCFGTDSIQGIETGTVSGIQISEDGSTLEFQIAFPETAREPEITVVPGETEGAENDTEHTGNNAADGTQENTGNNAGDSIPENSTGLNGTENENSTGSGQNTGGETPAAGTGTGSSAGNSQSGISAAAGGTAAAAQQNTASEEESEADASGGGTELSSQYNTDVTAFTVSPDENMILSVSVDELDINSVELGQTAEVTFDAIEDQTVQGEVTKIGSTASVNGGVAKYTVELTIPKSDEMKQGMNASAVITIEEREQVLTLPMNALQEQGDRTFVYTQKEEDGTLTGEVEITTGLSDGTTVEITEGLEEGDTVYYMRIGSSSGSSDAGSAGGSGGGEMPDMEELFGGEMPGGNFGGGEMPDMGGQRGGGPGM